MKNTEKRESPRSRVVAIRMPPTEFEELQTIAEDEGRTISNAVRRLVQEAMRTRERVELRA